MAGQLNALNQLQGMRLADLYAKINLLEEQFNKWLVDLGLLHGRQPCVKCGNDMKMTPGEKKCGFVTVVSADQAQRKAISSTRSLKAAT